MQILDELEPTRRGPYGGGIGHVSFTGEMDMALALRTMVIPTGSVDYLYDYSSSDKPRREWTVHIQVRRFERTHAFRLLLPSDMPGPLIILSLQWVHAGLPGSVSKSVLPAEILRSGGTICKDKLLNY